MRKAPAKVRGLFERDGGRWQYDFVHKGTRYVETFENRKDALDALTIKRGQLRDARLGDEFGLERGPRAAVTVGGFYTDEFLPWAESSRSAATLKNDRSVLGRFVGFVGENRRIETIEEPEIESYIVTRKALKKSALRDELRRIGRFLGLAVKRHPRTLKANPMDGVKMPKPDARQYTLLEPEDEAKFWRALESPYLELFQTVLYCGLRQGEALALKVKDVNFARATVSVFQHKTGAVKVVPLIPQAVKVLREVIPAKADAASFVFHYEDGRPISKAMWSQAFRAARLKCKLTGLRPHDLRHSLGSRLGNAGVPIASIAALLGHAPGSRATLHYVHANGDDGRAALASVFK